MDNKLSGLEKFDLLKKTLTHECAMADVKYIIQLRALKEVYNEILKEMEDDFIKNGRHSKQR